MKAREIYGEETDKPWGVVAAACQGWCCGSACACWQLNLRCLTAKAAHRLELAVVVAFCSFPA